MNAQTKTVMSSQDLGSLGLNHVGYVRPVVADGQPVFAIHAADGTRIALMPSREQAVAAMIENDIQPVSVH